MSIANYVKEKLKNEHGRKIASMSQPLSEPAVVIFGTSITSAYLSGGTMLFRALVEAFLRRGWKVTFVEEHHPWLITHTDFSARHSQLNILCYSSRHELIELNVHRRFLDDATLVLKFSGSSGSHDRYIDEWLAGKRKEEHYQFFLVYVDVDAPMRLPYIVNHPQFYLRKILPSFDGVWVMLGGERAMREYQSLKAQQVWVTPVAIDASAFCPTSPSTEYATDLLFVGNPTYGREAGLKRLFFDAAMCCPDYQFLLAGADWKELLLPNNMRYLGYVPSERLPELYSSARLVLNVTREEMAAYGHAASLRLFEAAACGACLVSDSWPGLERLFVPGEEVLVAESTEEVLTYLSTIGREQAQAIGINARKRVERDHTVDIRVGQFLGLTDIV
jgi:spore maturation protein CgeB